MKTIFLSFADSRYHHTLHRIRQQARSLNLFSRIYVVNESYLSEQFSSAHRMILHPECKGYGYWIWKPQAVLQAMKSASNGDILLYADAGCHLNAGGKERLLQYIRQLKNSVNFVMASPLPPSFTEACWTKGDLLNYFKVFDNPAITDTAQVQATTFLIKKCAGSLLFLHDWLAVYESDYDLVNDSPSRQPSKDCFLEHRHDQSVFSILCKLNGFETIPFAQIYVDSDWSRLSDCPIWAMRDKGIHPPLPIRCFRRTSALLRRLISPSPS